MKRQSSFTGIHMGRRNSFMAKACSIVRWRFLVWLALVIAGVLGGHMMVKSLIGTPGSVVMEQPHRFMRPRQESFAQDVVSRNLDHSTTWTDPSNNHVNPNLQRSGVPGVSRKKDLSVQFRDYLPQKYFITCGEFFPLGINLFLDTYAASEEFKLISLVPDLSYSPLFKMVPNHTLLAPVVAIGESNRSLNIELRELGKTTMMKKIVDGIDFPNWLKENLHQDDYVVVKLTSVFHENYMGIIKGLTETNAVEWIDKLYTSSKDPGEIIDSREMLEGRNLPVNVWNDHSETFSDFDEVNVPRVADAGKEIIRCSHNNVTALLLYAPEATSDVIRCLMTLNSFAKGVPLPISLFVTRTSLDSKRILDLVQTFDLGLYIDVMKFPWIQKGNFIKLRNRIVNAEHSFSKAAFNLSNIMVVNDHGFDFPRMCHDRHVNVIFKYRDVSALVGWIDGGNTSNISLAGGDLIAVDISRPNMDALVLYLLKRYNNSIIPLRSCVAYGPLF